jgi:hypothetical protein
MRAHRLSSGADINCACKPQILPALKDEIRRRSPVDEAMSLHPPRERLLPSQAVATSVAWCAIRSRERA